MEGPIDSNAGNKNASVGKMQIKGKTMQPPTGHLPRGTCHTEFSVENKYTYLNTGAYHEPRGGWEGDTQRKATKLGKAKPGGQNFSAMAQLHMPTTIICWETEDLPVNSDY